uniref:Uncharacterized protein n=1 Tax=Proboscia inermis TaxID=420281 RepID=A0A7S0GKT4_9STRA|mmetsp:Transcript_5485/g.5717  ORF Transcript_5485/g.5717 Transcript_5485/m.5717 type:complete len:132 (+) Transcript_5485:329-724(+)
MALKSHVSCFELPHDICFKKKPQSVTRIKKYGKMAAFRYLYKKGTVLLVSVCLRKKRKRHPINQYFPPANERLKPDFYYSRLEEGPAFSVFHSNKYCANGDFLRLLFVSSRSNIPVLEGSQKDTNWVLITK